ncbi:uncharacterized protein DS421_9g286660 [Arachis hypogaea]|nr:uncharacterized protein DS421_9g286660 [Arachis hypogaea]
MSYCSLSSLPHHCISFILHRRNFISPEAREVLSLPPLSLLTAASCHCSQQPRILDK